MAFLRLFYLHTLRHFLRIYDCFINKNLINGGLTSLFVLLAQNNPKEDKKGHKGKNIT